MRACSARLFCSRRVNASDASTHVSDSRQRISFEVHDTRAEDTRLTGFFDAKLRYRRGTLLAAKDLT
jgi:hypothetical protein